jgi:predicted transcriptional regulator
MKSVLISIQPKWCELIVSGKKTVEVRKTKPKLETPFKVYIYETQGRTETPFVDEEGHYIFKGRAQVIGEFVCNEIENLTERDLFEGMDEISNSRIENYSCVDIDELLRYKGSKNEIYGWHISDLVIYDKPRELSEFFLARHCFNYKNVDIVENVMGDYVTQYFNNPLCRRCMYYDNGLNWCEKIDGKKAITRPPQSWCYVESEDTE